VCFEKKKHSSSTFCWFLSSSERERQSSRALFSFSQRSLSRTPTGPRGHTATRSTTTFCCPVDVKECHRDEPRRSVQRRVDGTRVYLRPWCADQRVLAGCDVATSQCDTHRRTSTPAVHVCKYPKTLTNLANSGKA
jgi:hypothetical protein